MNGGAVNLLRSYGLPGAALAAVVLATAVLAARGGGS